MATQDPASHAEDYLSCLTAAALTRLVRRATDTDKLNVSAWQTMPMTSGRSGASVYRVSGTGQDQGSGMPPWSLILKFCTSTRRFSVHHDADDPSWQRECLLGESRLLEADLPGLRPARFVESVRLSPTETALWFEDVGDAWAQDWSIERYGLAAFHLGQFNARFAGKPPQHAWLGLDQWPRYVQAFCPDAVQSLRTHRDHPDVLSVYPRALQSRLYAIDKDCQALIDSARAGASMSLTHGDPGGRNLFDLEGRTVAIDYDEVGISPLGEDLARMVGSSLHWFFIGRMGHARELVDLVLTRYIDGLHAAGCQVDAASVACVYRTVLGTIYALSYTGIANCIVENRIAQRARDAYKTTVPELLEHMGAIAAFCADEADEA